MAECSSMSQKVGLLLPKFFTRPAVRSSLPPRPLTSKRQEAKQDVRSCRCLDSAIKKIVAATDFFIETQRKVIEGGVLPF